MGSNPTPSAQKGPRTLPGAVGTPRAASARYDGGSVHASVLIAYLDATDVHHSQATQIIAAAADDHRTLGLSTITLAEVFAGAVRAGHVDALKGVLDAVGYPRDPALAGHPTFGTEIAEPPPPPPVG